MRVLLVASAVLVLLPSQAAAGQVSHSVTVGPIPIGGSAQTTLPQFDGSLGVLRLARVSICGRVSGTLGFENTSASAQSVGGYASGTYVGAIVPWTIGGFGSSGANPAFIPDVVPLAAYDGVTDYGGPSGITLSFSGQMSDGNPCPSLDVYQDSQIATFVGSGSVVASAGPTLPFGVSTPPGIVSTSNVTAEVTFTVVYLYDPFPTWICIAQGHSGCPCGNPGSLGSGAGCNNSLGTGGGVLQTSGAASIANDTYVLSGTGMTNSNALYFQGTTFLYAQAPYGDGLRCVTGSVVRLGTRTNVAGASQVPSAGGTPISVLGGVVAPGTRCYQVVYRDNASFCTSSTFNATNGQAVLWGP